MDRHTRALVQFWYTDWPRQPNAAPTASSDHSSLSDDFSETCNATSASRQRHRNQDAPDSKPGSSASHLIAYPSLLRFLAPAVTEHDFVKTTLPVRLCDFVDFVYFRRAASSLRQPVSCSSVPSVAITAALAFPMVTDLTVLTASWPLVATCRLQTPRIHRLAPSPSVSPAKVGKFGPRPWASARDNGTAERFFGNFKSLIGRDFHREGSTKRVGSDKGKPIAR